MGGHRGKVMDPMTWSRENERAFIGILYEYVKAGKLQCSTFTRDNWEKINKEMVAITKRDYGVERLKSKWNRLRKSHRLFSQLLAHTGVTWDLNTNQVNAPEDVWQHFYTINKSEYKVFRKEGCQDYELLGEIFGETTASGVLHNASTQLPPTSDKERQLEDDFLNKGVHVQVKNGDIFEDTITHQQENDTTPNKRRRKEPKINKSDKLHACMEQWTASVSQRTEEIELRKLYLKEKPAKLQSKSHSSQTSDCEVTSQASDPYSTEVCIDILNDMEGLSDEAYAKGVMAFEKESFRISFVRMPAHRRGDVLKLMI